MYAHRFIKNSEDDMEDFTDAEVSSKKPDELKKTRFSSPEITYSHCVCGPDSACFRQERSSSPECDSLNASPRIGRRSLGSLKKSSSACHRVRRRNSHVSPSGYEQYSKSLLEVPMILDYGDASSDDLSSEWESDVNELQHVTRSKVRIDKCIL